MDVQKDLENIELQLSTIKNDSAYKRLLTAQRGIKDDQRFQAYTLQIKTLEIRKEKLLKEKLNDYTPNRRINRTSIKKPDVVNLSSVSAKSIANLTKKMPMADIDKRTMVQMLTDKPTPKGRLRPTVNISKQPVQNPEQKVEDQEDQEFDQLNQQEFFQTEEGVKPKNAIRISNVNMQPAKAVEKEQSELMIKPVRTSIKKEKIPISKLQEFHSTRKAKTIVKPADEEVKRRTVNSIKKSKKASEPEPEIEDLIDPEIEFISKKPAPAPAPAKPIKETKGKQSKRKPKVLENNVDDIDTIDREMEQLLEDL